MKSTSSVAVKVGMTFRKRVAASDIEERASERTHGPSRADEGINPRERGKIGPQGKLGERLRGRCESVKSHRREREREKEKVREVR